MNETRAFGKAPLPKSGTVVVMLGDLQPGLDVALATMVSRLVTAHPCERKADSESVAWAKRFGLADSQKALHKVAGIHAGSCAAHTYPLADERVVLLGARLITWLFLFDDAHGEGPHAEDARDLMGDFSSCSRLLRTGLLPFRATAFHRALLDLRTEAQALSRSQDWMTRFADSFDCYFGGCVMEYYARHGTTRTEVNEYRRLRAWSIGTFPVFDLIEFSKGPLSEKEAAAPELANLKERAALLCAWANDIYSYKKEANDGDGMNVVAVLKRQYGLDSAEAYGATAEVFNVDWTLFQQEKSLLLELESPALSEYAEGLEEWIFGNLQWTALCRRYHLETRAVS